MFVSDNNLINVVVYYRKIKHKYIALTSKEMEKKNELDAEEKQKYSVLNVKMKELTWGLHNSLQEDAMVENAQGDRVFNFKIFRENRLQKLIKSWDAKDNDKEVPVSSRALSMLAPPIAEAILRAYDEESTLSEEEEGK